MTPFLKFCASHSFGVKRFLEDFLGDSVGPRRVFSGGSREGFGVEQKYFEKILRTQKPRNHAAKRGIFGSHGRDFGQISTFSACTPPRTSV